jgi:hypothetical protein
VLDEDPSRHSLPGNAAYIASFFFPAAVLYGPGAKSLGSLSGIECAFMSLQPVQDLFHNGIGSGTADLALSAQLISGLINPVFLINIILLARNPESKPAAILRIVLLFMLAAPLVYFYHGIDVRPLVGYFLWTTAILMVLLNTAHLQIFDDVWKSNDSAAVEA